MSNHVQPQLAEVAKLFLKLGTIGFGGPAAHIAMMEDEVVNRRQWLTREKFLDLVGATNLIPGPNSTEMAIHIGYIYAGWLGLITAGLCFILPAVLLTGSLAWVYVNFGSLPAVAPLLYGIKPAVLAIIIAALWRLAKSALQPKGATVMKTRQLLIIAIGCAASVFAGLNEVFAILIGGFLGALWLNLSQNGTNFGWFLGYPVPLLMAQTGANSSAAAQPSVWQLGLVFLKVGAVLFGSGYVLVAFLEGELVGRGWLTQQQLLEAIAIGQFTPGPVLSTATFIGYIIAGWGGAATATIGIFLPSFGFVAAVNPLIPKLRAWKWTGAFLDAVNACALALMVTATWKLALATFNLQLPVTDIDWLAVGIATVATIAALRFRVSSLWLVLGGALVGLCSLVF